jgi:hypothetical protein
LFGKGDHPAIGTTDDDIDPIQRHAGHLDGLTHCENETNPLELIELLDGALPSQYPSKSRRSADIDAPSLP